MTADDVRARFEAWLLRLGYTSRPERRPSGKYVNGQIQGNWLAWQAAHADLSGEVRAMRACAIKYLGWLDVADQGRALEEDLAKFAHQEKP